MTDQPASYVNSYQPPTAVASDAPTATPGDDAPSSASESIEDQNIFHLLGITDGTDEQREGFLDELQQVIWEDFVENDVSLLLTEEEYEKFKQIMTKGDTAQVQEEMIVYLESLIPDLEEIMLEKALELKEDLVKERIAGLKEYYQGQDTQLQDLKQAEDLIAADKWRSAADILNTLSH